MKSGVRIQPGPKRTGREAEWLAEIGRRVEATRRGPLRIRDLALAIGVCGVLLGLGRFILDVFSGPPRSTWQVWLALLALTGLVAILGVIAAVVLGRISSAAYLWGTRRTGALASLALSLSVLADLASIGLLLLIALGVTLVVILSAMAYAMALAD